MPRPLVAILMGSKSDAPVMEKARTVLDELGVACESRVLSAHRSPSTLEAYVAEAPSRGVRVFICGAGMAAHLAGAVAARTCLPVIGVPLSATLGGLDALLSTVQMPPGIPVATVGVDAARNAAYLAAQILAVGDEVLGERLEAARARMEAEALASSGTPASSQPAAAPEPPAKAGPPVGPRVGRGGDLR